MFCSLSERVLSPSSSLQEEQHTFCEFIFKQGDNLVLHPEFRIHKKTAISGKKSETLSGKADISAAHICFGGEDFTRSSGGFCLKTLNPRLFNKTSSGTVSVFYDFLKCLFSFLRQTSSSNSLSFGITDTP
jgi:hypothetical protein